MQTKRVDPPTEDPATTSQTAREGTDLTEVIGSVAELSALEAFFKAYDDAYRHGLGGEATANIKGQIPRAEYYSLLTGNLQTSEASGPWLPETDAIARALEASIESGLTIVKGDNPLSDGYGPHLGAMRKHGGNGDS